MVLQGLQFTLLPLLALTDAYLSYDSKPSAIRSKSHPAKKNKIYSNIKAYIAQGLGIKRFSSIFGRSSLSSIVRWVRLFINLRENAAYRARILEISLVI